MKDIHELMYNPPRAVTATMNEVERRSRLVSELTWGIPEIDTKFNPVLPGEVMVKIARPGMGKTISSIYLTKHWSKAVRKNIVNGKPQVVVYFTVETMIEQFMMVYTSGDSGQTVSNIGRGKADKGKIQMALAKTMGENLFIVGQSQETEATGGVYFPSMLDLDRALTEIRSQGYQIASVFVDYIQQVGDSHNRFPTGKERTAVVEENVALCKALANKHKTGFVVDAQAGRQVDDYGGIRFPLLDDAQHASLIEQAADKVFSITLPAKYIEEGTNIAINGFLYEVKPSTMGLKMVKQRFGECTKSDVWILDVDLGKAEMKIQATNGEDSEDNDF